MILCDVHMCGVIISNAMKSDVMGFDVCALMMCNNWIR